MADISLLFDFWTFHLQKYSPWQKEELYLKKYVSHDRDQTAVFCDSLAYSRDQTGTGEFQPEILTILGLNPVSEIMAANIEATFLKKSEVKLRPCFQGLLASKFPAAPELTFNFCLKLKDWLRPSFASFY